MRIVLQILVWISQSNGKNEIHEIRNWNPPWGRISRARIISKKKTAVHENSVANLFFWFPDQTVKRKSMKPGFGFLNWNPPWGRISRRWNPDFKIYIRISQSNATYVARNIHVISNVYWSEGNSLEQTEAFLISQIPYLSDDFGLFWNVDTLRRLNYSTVTLCKNKVK